MQQLFKITEGFVGDTTNLSTRQPLFIYRKTNLHLQKRRPVKYNIMERAGLAHPVISACRLRAVFCH